jgi:hypothetical protein
MAEIWSGNLTLAPAVSERRVFCLGLIEVMSWPNDPCSSTDITVKDYRRNVYDTVTTVYEPTFSLLLVCAPYYILV